MALPLKVSSMKAKKSVLFSMHKVMADIWKVHNKYLLNKCDI